MYTFYLASTTPNGLTCAQGLLAAGWRQTLTPNPIDAWARAQGWPVFYVDRQIPRALANQLAPVDFLLVVDFGFYVPGWLIDFPRCLSVNVHPSRLPEWRGASPGQHVILSGAHHSAVSIMTLGREMDAGDLLAQLPLAVAPTWTSADYYAAAFTLARDHLAPTLTNYATGRLTPTPQTGTPTFATKISKTDAFIPYTSLTDPARAATIERQIRAYTPWPLAWTLAPTSQGEKRLQLLAAHLEAGQLVLDQAKLEGSTAKPWSVIRPQLLA